MQTEITKLCEQLGHTFIPFNKWKKYWLSTLQRGKVGMQEGSELLTKEQLVRPLAIVITVLILLPETTESLASR